MAESKIESTIKLTLTVYEATWLKQLLQNAVLLETGREQEARVAIFSALPDFNTLSEL